MGGFTSDNAVWRELRNSVAKVFLPYPAHGAFSPTRKTSSFVLTNTGLTANASAAGSAQSTQPINDSARYAVEFTVIALGAVVSVGAVDDSVAGSPTNIGTTPYYDSSGTSQGNQNGGSTATYTGTPWSVGDKIGLVATSTKVTFFRNGVRVQTFDFFITLAAGLHFYMASAGAGPQLTAETITDLMAFPFVYQANDWPIAAPFVDPPATAITLTPSPATGTTGAASSFIVAANGSLSGTLNVTVASSDGTDAISVTSFSLTNGARSANFTVTASAAGSKTLSTTNSGSLTNASATFTVTAAATYVSFNPALSTAGTFTNSNRTVTSAATASALANGESVSVLQRGDATAGYGYAVEFTLDSLPVSGGTLAGLKLVGGKAYNSSDLDISTSLTARPYFKQDGAWDLNGTDTGTSLAWVAGDKIGLVVYDIDERAGVSSRAAIFRNGTLIGFGPLAFTNGFPIRWAFLTKTGVATAVATTVQGNIASMTYGSTYAAYRDTNSVQTMSNAIGWPGSDVQPAQALTNGTQLIIDGTPGYNEPHYIDVPAGKSSLVIEGRATTGGSHFDVYVKFGSPPTTTVYDSTFDVSGKTTVDDTITSPAAGRYFILIIAVSTSAGSITATYS